MYIRPDEADGPDRIPPAQPPKRRMTIYQTRPGRPRWILHIQAVVWRFLMNIGMFLHRMASPRPPKPTFTRNIPSTISSKEGTVALNFYVPRDYETQRRLWIDRSSADVEMQESEESVDRSKRRLSAIGELGQAVRRKSLSGRRWGGYPVVINFHGGGFTLGHSSDDARWCSTVVDECNAVVISVDYRLAPESPFPTAVEDGVDAVLYVHRHARELGIDRKKIALSGFSSGGNMAFTVCLRLHDEITGFPRDEAPIFNPTVRQKAERALQGAASKVARGTADDGAASSPTSSPSSSSSKLPAKPVANSDDTSTLVNDPKSSHSTMRNPTKTTSTTTTHNLPSITICSIISWYPSLDYTRTREQRRATTLRKDQELPALFTDLFDDSYLHPPDTISLDSPYLSPGVAPTSLLRAALPQEIILHTCEWDMLLSEGQAFRDRLSSPDIGKHVWYKMVEGVPHGWDKAPNPLKPTPGVREFYLGACKEMRRVFGQADDSGSKGSGVRPRPERMTTVGGFPTAAPRQSTQVVN